LVFVAVVAGLAAGGARLDAQRRLTQNEALELAFPGAELERITAFLEPAQTARAGELAGSGVEVRSSVVTMYLARRSGNPVGVAYFDAHRVRTLPQVLMIVVGVDGRVARVETVSFQEPPEYGPPGGWLRLFEDRELDNDLAQRRGIPNITGATLTAGAVTRAVRRVLALHDVIDPWGDDQGHAPSAPLGQRSDDRR
jgi:Na+-translocating ferredoxin:NAD+ oxidoreductase RnfG subunit